MIKSPCKIIEKNVDASKLLEFGGDFPFANTPSIEQDRGVFIDPMLKKFYHNPQDSSITISVDQAIDNNISKYYNWHDQCYMGQSANYCEQNGCDSDGIAGELRCCKQIGLLIEIDHKNYSKYKRDLIRNMINERFDGPCLNEIEKMIYIDFESQVKRIGQKIKI